MDLNATSVSELLVLVQYSNGRFYDQFFSYSLRLILSELSTFSTHLTILLIFFLIIGLVSLSYQTILWRCTYLSEEFDCIFACFSFSSGVVRKIQSDVATFLRFFSLRSLEYNFYLLYLRYSLKSMATKSFTSASVKIFK